MWRGIVAFLFAAVFAAWGQKYDGPRPPKRDLPYLRHADNLVPTEAATAKEEKRKNDTLYIIDGASSPAKTPLASPILVVQIDQLVPDRLQLFKLDSKGGHREIVFPARKDSTRPFRIEVTRLSSDNIYKIEVYDSLPTGEYSLSPEDSNQAFCFQVY